MSLKRFELFRLMPSSKITVETVATGGGTLRTGSYQVAYRLIDDYSGRSTKFCVFSHPINISNSDTNGDKNGAVNTTTDKSIIVSFNVSNEELDLYTTYQIAVIESNTASGQSNVVSLSDQFALSAGKNTYKIDSNEFFDRIGIEEASVDDAAIKTFKTIVFKNNKLLGGNVKYKDLSFDNGDPSVQSGEIIKRKIPVSGNTDKSLSESRGYFLDEVYRFYVSFWDEYGNFSFPFPLNMSSVVGNTAESFNGFKDMKFPKRDVNNKIIETVRFGENDEHLLTVNTGLRLTISNIPTWSKGFVVLRSLRKKGVLFQSPLIPTTIVQSPDAQGAYPGEGAGAPNPLGTILPKNMGLSLNKAIVRKQGTDFSYVEWSSNYQDFEFCKKIHVAFPPEIIFNNSGVPYLDFIAKEKISVEAVDYCMLGSGFSNLLSRNKSIAADTIEFKNDGSRASSSIILASASSDYASDRLSRSEFETEILSTGRSVVDEVGSLSVVPSSVSSIPVVGISSDSPTSDFGNHSDLKITPDGPYNGNTPTNQRMVVVTTKGERPDLSYYGVFGLAPDYNTQAIVHGKQINGNPAYIYATDVVPVTGQESNPKYSVAQSFVEIVSFKSSLGDDRYGDPFSKQEIVSTGAIATYSTPPANFSIEVYGGDCYISPFTFKVHDSHYAVVNSGNWGDQGKAWGKSFKDSGDDELRRPFPYKSLGVSIGVYLESEVNGLYSEEFTTKGRDDIYNQITPSVLSWSGTAVKGSFYSYQGKIYRALINDTSGVTPLNSIGYIYEDLSLSLKGSYYPIKLPIDMFLYPKSVTENKSPFLYLYNPEYSIQDRSKPFPFIYSKDKINRVNFSSRIVYSDTGILQTNIEGFNRFRVANIYDLEESNGSITKLVNHKGNLYGIQESSFCYIPFEASQIETADGVNLSIQSSQIVGRPQYIERYGSSHMRTVVSTPYGLMFGDFENSKIIRFEGSVTHLNDLGISSYIKQFSDSIQGLKISDKDAQFYYDYSVDDVVFKMGNEAIVLGPNNVFKTRIVTASDWMYGMYNDSEHFVIGNNNGNLVLSHINSSGSNKNILGSPMNSSIKFAVTDQGAYTKMYYIVKFLASKSESVNIKAYQNNSLISEYDDTTVADRWAGFLLNRVRDNSTLRRVRGEYAVIESSVLNNEISSAITKVQAAYRIL